MFSGSFVALITPFKDGKIDEVSFQRFCEWQIDQGTDGLVPVGTTGESPTLSHEEHKRIVSLCVEVSNGRVPVIAGAGSNSTETTVEFVRYAKEAGADGTLVVTPYYNKPTQEGLYQHFKAAAEAADLPLIIYNIPPRSVIDMSVETMARLAVIPNIVGVKDATADLVRPLATRLALGPEFCQLSGEDATVTAYLAQGGHGCISVTANVAPKLCSSLHAAWRAGDLEQLSEIRDMLMPLHKALFIESSPAPTKYAVSQLGMCAPTVRPPIYEVTDATKAEVRAAMEHAGIFV